MSEIAVKICRFFGRKIAVDGHLPLMAFSAGIILFFDVISKWCYGIDTLNSIDGIIWAD